MSIVLGFGETFHGIAENIRLQASEGRQFRDEVSATFGLPAERFIRSWIDTYRQGPRIDIGNIAEWLRRFVPPSATDVGASIGELTHVTMPGASMMLFGAFGPHPQGAYGGMDMAIRLFSNSDREITVDTFMVLRGGEGDRAHIPWFAASIEVEDGRPLGLSLKSARNKNLNADDDDAGIVANAALAACLTLQIMNCKNVTLVERQPPRAARRRMEREGRAGEMATWHTIDIEPFRRVMSDVGHVERDGFKKALHKCRAHFADYTQGKGLFGKHKGIFLIGEHWRGDPELGMVRGNHRLKPPQDDGTRYGRPPITGAD